MNCKLNADNERAFAIELAQQLSKIRKAQGGPKRFAKLSINDTQSKRYQFALDKKLIELPPMGEKTSVRLTLKGELEILFV